MSNTDPYGPRRLLHIQGKLVYFTGKKTPNMLGEEKTYEPPQPDEKPH